MAALAHRGYKTTEGGRAHQRPLAGENVVTTESVASPSHVASERALAALRRHAASPTWLNDGAIAATLLEVVGPDDERIAHLLRGYLERDMHYGRDNAFRYPWPISTLGEAGDASYDIGAHTTWWRPLEVEQRQRQGRARVYARRLALPGVLATQLELWSRVASRPNANAAAAARLLAEVQPSVEHDVARAIGAMDPWADTLMLWQLTNRPGPLRLVRGLLFALAIRYGTIAERDDGIVHGIQFPFHRVPLASATAHLAMGLWQFGLYPTLLPWQLAFLRSTVRRGAWADGSQPPDVLTTLAAAEALTRIDPQFDPEPTIAFFSKHQEPGGWWRALDPEVPWLTASIVDWMRRSELPFAERFAWPQVALWQRDYITGLPTMAFFAGIADAIERIGGSLAVSQIEVAFCDLAGFGSFNTRHGQAAGDDALRIFAATLSATGHLVVRIGGDELLVIGRPTEHGALEPALSEFMDHWPQTLARDLPGTIKVRPRIMLHRGTAGSLRELHSRLGIAIGELKAATPDVPDRGVLVWH